MRKLLGKIQKKDAYLAISIFGAISIINLLLIIIAPYFVQQTSQRYFIFNLPPILTVLSNFDGLNYTHIGTFGYGDYQQAFFPLYPLLIFVVSKVLSLHTFYAGLLISNLSFLASIYLLLKVISKTLD